MSEAPRFGTAGLSDSYRVRSFDPQAMAEYTASFGLTAFEYQCGRGVRLGLDKAAALKEAFDAKGITFSVHAPYYISMSSLEEDKRLNSVNYLLQSCALVKALGGRRVIFHAGSCGKQSREAALEKGYPIRHWFVHNGRFLFNNSCWRYTPYVHCYRHWSAC